MNYDQEIIRVLTEAGDRGLQVQKIARHVFNASNSLFNEISFDDVYQYVRQYLTRNSNSSCSLIEKTGERGYYRLSPYSAEAQQLVLQFREKQEDAPPEPMKDLSLSLFPENTNE